MESGSKFLFAITALASLAISLTLLQEVAAPSHQIIIINRSGETPDLPIFQNPPNVEIHGTYNYKSPSHPELNINANFDESNHSHHIHLQWNLVKPSP